MARCAQEIQIYDVGDGRLLASPTFIGLNHSPFLQFLLEADPGYLKSSGSRSYLQEARDLVHNSKRNLERNENVNLASRGRFRITKRSNEYYFSFGSDGLRRELERSQLLDWFVPRGEYVGTTKEEVEAKIQEVLIANPGISVMKNEGSHDTYSVPSFNKEKNDWPYHVWNDTIVAVKATSEKET